MHCGNQTVFDFDVIIRATGGRKSLKLHAYYNSLKSIFPSLSWRLSKQVIMEMLEIV